MTRHRVRADQAKTSRGAQGFARWQAFKDHHAGALDIDHLPPGQQGDTIIIAGIPLQPVFEEREAQRVVGVACDHHREAVEVLHKHAAVGLLACETAGAGAHRVGVNIKGFIKFGPVLGIDPGYAKNIAFFDHERPTPEPIQSVGKQKVVKGPAVGAKGNLVQVHRTLQLLAFADVGQGFKQDARVNPEMLADPVKNIGARKGLCVQISVELCAVDPDPGANLADRARPCNKRSQVAPEDQPKIGRRCL